VGQTPARRGREQLVAAHFGGTRNPLVISWPKGIKPDKTPRPQFHHINDIAPTLYEVIGIKPPEEVNGIKQDPLDGVSMAYTFADPKAPNRKKTQYFENNASRGIYHDGWFACTFGPFIPWDTPGSMARLKVWDANKDVWQLYDISMDFSQADGLAAKEPERLAKRMLQINGGARILQLRKMQYDLIQRDTLNVRHRLLSVRRRECSHTENGIQTNRPGRKCPDCQNCSKCALALPCIPQHQCSERFALRSRAISSTPTFDPGDGPENHTWPDVRSVLV